MASCLKQVLIMSSGLCAFGGLIMLYQTMFNPAYSYIYDQFSDSLIAGMLATNETATNGPTPFSDSSDVQSISISTKSMASPSIKIPETHLMIPSLTDAPQAEPINDLDPFKSIREARIRRPPRCSNSTHHVLPITPSDHNWAPFYLRCNDLYNRHHPEKRPWIDEGLISKELFYVHVFKAGGSTIRINMNDLMNEGIVSNLTLLGSTFVIYGGDLNEYSKTENDKYSQHSILDDFIDNNTITFSFVRDPVDRFLSAYYETHFRRMTTDENYGMKGRERMAVQRGDHKHPKLDIMRLWTQEILYRMDVEREALRKLKDRRRMTDQPPTHSLRAHPATLRTREFTPFEDGPNAYVNSHLAPNMQFLVGQHYRTSIPFSFIGDLRYFTEDFPKIVEPFIADEELRRNHTKFMELMKDHKVRKNDNWDYKLRQFNIDRSELSDDDLMTICEMYYLDYLCLPFDLPEPCDVNKLIEKHYGVDVVYDDCY